LKVARPEKKTWEKKEKEVDKIEARTLGAGGGKCEPAVKQTTGQSCTQKKGTKREKVKGKKPVEPGGGGGVDEYEIT